MHFTRFNYTELVEECRNPFILRLDNAYRMFCLFVAILILAVLILSLLWWKQNRQKSRLALRTEPSLILVSLYAVCGVSSYSLHTFSLDHPSLLNVCAFRWATLLMAIVAFNGVICLRLYSYYVMTQIYQEFTRTSRDGKREVSSYGNPSTGTDTSRLELLLYRSSDAFSMKIVVGILVIGAGMIFPVIYFSCPVLGNDVVCSAGDGVGLPSLLLYGFLVFISATMLGMIFSRTKKLPDPFGVKREVAMLVFFAVVFFLVFMVLGALLENPLEDEDIEFKISPSILADLLILVSLCYAIPYQVHKSIHAEKKFIHEKSLRDILKDPLAKDLLRSYLKSEVSCNNLDFYLAATEWKKSFRTTQFDARQKAAMNIINRWIFVESEHEINISSTARQHLRSDTENSSNFPVTLFDEILEEIYLLINNDSFMRFQASPAYKLYTGLLVDVDELVFASYSTM